MKKRYHPPIRYSLTKAILDILLDMGESIPLFESPYTRIKRLWREDRGVPVFSKWRYNRAIKYLEYRHKLKIVKQGDKIFLKLTHKGKIQALFGKLGSSELQREKKWDGKWRLVVWDIPESSKLQRNKIRRFFKSIGFYRLQLSAFIRPYPLPSQAVDFLRESGLIKFIRFLRIDQIDDDKSLRDHFNLPQKE